jgi:hypothetical protein
MGNIPMEYITTVEYIYAVIILIALLVVIDKGDV